MLTSLLIASLAVAGAVSGADTSASDPTAVATLEVKQGAVMVASKDGAFEQVNTGASANAGQRVMVLENSQALIAYPNGCSISLSQPGVYTVASKCKPLAKSKTTQAGAKGAAKATAAMAGGVGAGAAALKNLGKIAPTKPVSR